MKIRCLSFCRVEVLTLFPAVDSINSTCIRQCELPVNQQVKQHLLAMGMQSDSGDATHNMCSLLPVVLYLNLNTVSLHVLWNIDRVCSLLL